jgi:hypothetical protein
MHSVTGTVSGADKIWKAGSGLRDLKHEINPSARSGSVGVGTHQASGTTKRQTPLPF